MFTINGTNKIVINNGIYYQCNIPLFFLELVTDVQKLLKWVIMINMQHWAVFT